jgi:2-dehydro-3-deoxy-D-arabinonate dehydratase
MYLTRYQTSAGARWALDGRFLPEQFNVGFLLELPAPAIPELLKTIVTSTPAEGKILAPLEPTQEVWACGVTYLRSRDARKAESNVGDVYERVYDAERPEVFFKSPGWRVMGPGAPIRIRRDSHWNVPEPELTLVVNSRLEIVGFCVGNDVSSRSIEGENPLYLPQAKTYNGSCALGPGIRLADVNQFKDVPIRLEILRAGQPAFTGEIRSSQMKRTYEELVAYLGQELNFPQGVFVMTGTGLVPSDDFTLQPGDLVRITVADLVLENEVQS